MDQSSPEAYRIKTQTLREQFEIASKNLGEASSNLELTRTEHADLNRQIIAARALKERLDTEIGQRQQTIEQLIKNRQEVIEHNVTIEVNAKSKSADSLLYADSLTKEIGQLTTNTDNLKSVLVELSEAQSSLQDVLADRETTKKDIAERIKAGEARESDIAKREQDFISTQGFVDAKNTENARASAEIERHAAIIQKHYRSSGIEGDVYKDLGVVKDKLQ